MGFYDSRRDSGCGGTGGTGGTGPNAVRPDADFLFRREDDAGCGRDDTVRERTGAYGNGRDRMGTYGIVWERTGSYGIVRVGMDGNVREHQGRERIRDDNIRNVKDDNVSERTGRVERERRKQEGRNVGYGDSTYNGKGGIR